MATPRRTARATAWSRSPPPPRDPAPSGLRLLFEVVRPVCRGLVFSSRLAALQEMSPVRALFVLASGVRRGHVLADRAQGVPEAWVQEVVRLVRLITSFRPRHGQRRNRDVS